MRVGYQISIDVLAHRANLAAHRPPDPVVVITEVLADDQRGWQRHVHQVRFTGPAWTEYGWGPERAHARGVRFGAAIWVYTASPIEYLDDGQIWRRAE